MSAMQMIGPYYFSTLVEYFEKDPQLGSGSGEIFIEEGGALVDDPCAPQFLGILRYLRTRCGGAPLCIRGRAVS